MKIDLNLKIEEATSAADWVTNNRISAIQKEKSKKLPELQSKRLDEEEEELLNQVKASYTASDLKGLKVMHEHKDFQEGKEIILTLADTDILERDEYGKPVGLKEDEDVLENVNMADNDRKIARDKTIKRSRQPVYSGIDDYEFVVKNG